MKATTEAVLLALYATQQHGGTGLSKYVFSFLLPQLTDGGLGALLHYLEKKSWIRSERIAQTQYFLTSHGQAAVEARFSALNSSSDARDWSVLLFKQAPKQDPQFRYLRKQLLTLNAASLSRGCYIYPGTFPLDLQREWQELYASSIVIFTVQKWSFGDEFQIIIALFNLITISETYSSISNEMTRLISQNRYDKKLNHQQKKRFKSLFSNFHEIIAQDLGLAHYLPKTPSTMFLLEQTAQLLSWVKPD